MTNQIFDRALDKLIQMLLQVSASGLRPGTDSHCFAVEICRRRTRLVNVRSFALLNEKNRKYLENKQLMMVK